MKNIIEALWKNNSLPEHYASKKDFINFLQKEVRVMEIVQDRCPAPLNMLFKAETQTETLPIYIELYNDYSFRVFEVSFRPYIDAKKEN